MARTLTVSLPHDLGRAEARRRVEEGFGSFQSQLAAGVGASVAWDHRWEGDRMHVTSTVMGQKLTGRIDVADDAIGIEVDLPALLAGLAQRISGTLKTAGQQLLEKK